MRENDVIYPFYVTKSLIKYVCIILHKILFFASFGTYKKFWIGEFENFKILHDRPGYAKQKYFLALDQERHFMHVFGLGAFRQI